MKAQRQRLGEVVAGPDQLAWGHSLYLLKPVDWEPLTPCFVLDPEREAEHELDGFTYALGVAELQDAISNLLAQRPNATLEERLKAVQFYFENDAFLDAHAG